MSTAPAMVTMQHFALIKIKNPADNYQCIVFERKATFDTKKRFRLL